MSTSLSLSLCVCVCVCVCARACVLSVSRREGGVLGCVQTYLDASWLLA